MRTWMAGVMAVLGLGAACSTGTDSSTGGDLVLHVLPADTTIPVLGTVAYRLVATDAAGDTVPAPAVLWTARDSGVAGIAQDGTAVGRSPGVTTIYATAQSGETDSARLTVATSVGPCYGITTARKFTGSVQWGFKAVDQEAPSGFFITADDNGNVNADLTVQGTGPSVYLWSGTLSGSSSASVTQKITDHASYTATYTSTSGVMQPQPGGLGLPKLSLIVDAQRCTWRVVTGASLATLRTEFGTQTNSIDIVAMIQFAGVVPPDWRTAGLGHVNGTLMANSVAYAGLHPDDDVLSPLGFATEFFNGPSTAALQSSGGFHLDLVE